MSTDPGAAAVPPEAAQRYRASAPVFAGPTSVLFEGRDGATGRPVLVKCVRPEALATTADRQRVQRELHKLVQIRHPHLGEVLACGEDGGIGWLARPYVQGESLADRIAREGPLPVGDAARIGAQIAAALGKLHHHGVLHRDVRPGHVLLAADGSVRLIDAAIARSYRMPDGRIGTGTPGYVAPEGIAGKLVSFRSDLYSLGATLFEMLTGAPPFGPPESDDVLALQVGTDPPPLTHGVPEGLSRLVASLLAREPRERPFSAQQVERQLDPFATAADGVPGLTLPMDDAHDPEFDEPPTQAVPMLPLQGEGEDDEEDEAPTSVAGLSSGAQAAMEAGGFGARHTAVGRPNARPYHQSGGVGEEPARPFTQRNAPVATLAGMAPVAGAAMRPPTAATMRGLPNPAAMARPQVLPDAPNDFDEALDTVVQEDSRMFGLPEGLGGHALGSAVPPLPAPERPMALGHGGGFGAPSDDHRPTVPDSLRRSGNIPHLSPPVAATLPGPTPMLGSPEHPYAARPGVAELHPSRVPTQSFATGTSVPRAIGNERKPRTVPWILAGVGVAIIAGAGGYFFSVREAPAPADSAPAIATATEASAKPPAVAPTAPPAPVQPVARAIPVVTAPPARLPSSIPVVTAAPAPAPRPSPAPASPPSARARVAEAPARVVEPAARSRASRAAAAPREAPAEREAPVERAARTATPSRAETVPARRENALEQARRLINHREFAEARMVLQAAQREQPSNPEVHFLLGDVAARSHDLPAAIGELRAAVRLSPRNTAYLHRLADTQLAWNDRPGAVDTLRRLLAANPDDSLAQHKLDQLARPATSRTPSPAVRPAAAVAPSASSAPATASPPPRSGTTAPVRPGREVPIVTSF